MSAQTFENVHVAPIAKETAREIIVANHYSHKWGSTFGAANFGIFLNDKLLGVATYGHAMNPRAWDSITTVDHNQCLELNRLWIDDELGMNTETWFMGKTFRLLREQGYRLIQSFADGRFGVGTIYQAANFTYHGNHSTMFHKHATDGTLWHDTPFTNTASPQGMIQRNVMHAEQALKTFTVKTYRYLYPLDRAARKSILLPAQPYPKERNGLSEIVGYMPPVGQIARCIAMADMLLDTESSTKLRTLLARITDDPETAIQSQMDNPWVQELSERQALLPPTLFDI